LQAVYLFNVLNAGEKTQVDKKNNAVQY